MLGLIGQLSQQCTNAAPGSCEKMQPSRLTLCANRTCWERPVWRYFAADDRTEARVLLLSARCIVCIKGYVEIERQTKQRAARKQSKKMCCYSVFVEIRGGDAGGRREV